MRGHLSDMVAIEITIRPANGRRVCTLEYGIGADQLGEIRIGKPPAGIDGFEYPDWQMRLERRNSLIRYIAAEVAHSLAKVFDSEEFKHETAPQ